MGLRRDKGKNKTLTVVRGNHILNAQDFRTRRWILAAGACFVGGCGFRKDMQDLRPGEEGHVVQVRDGDALVLNTGLVVRLAEIEAPRAAWRDRKADAYGEDAKALLTQAALGRRAQIFYGGLTRDRYERAITHVIVKDETGRDIWANGLMVRSGAARVHSWADNCTRARQLYALENEARSAGRGLWALPQYAPISPNEMPDQGRGLVLVEGQIRRLIETDEADSFCRSASDAGLELELGLVLSRSRGRIPIEVGDKVRVRSGLRISDDGRRFLKLDHWAQFELLTA